MRVLWTITAATCMLATSAVDGFAQNGEAEAQRSTRDGVYTKAQAARGRDVFAGMCQACHTPAIHTGPTFNAAWGGLPLLVMFDYLRENMPKSDPGSLSADEYTQVIAYLLELNGMPSGQRELASDTAALRAIRYDTVTAGGAWEAMRAEASKRRSVETSKR